MKVIRQVIETYCDVCRGEADDETTTVPADEADAIRFTLDGKAKRLDVCAKHLDPTWATIRSFAVDDLTESTVGAYKICPKCGATVHRRSIPRHMESHGQPLVRNRPGPVPDETRTPCPVCGVAFKGKLGVAIHLRRIHGGSRATSEG